MEENKLTPFTDAPDTAVITCCHVTDDGAPVLYVSRIVSLRYIYELDHSVGLLKDMPCGCYAERESPAEEWIVNG